MKLIEIPFPSARYDKGGHQRFGQQSSGATAMYMYMPTCGTVKAADSYHEDPGLASKLICTSRSASQTIVTRQLCCKAWVKIEALARDYFLYTRL